MQAKSFSKTLGFQMFSVKKKLFSSLKAGFCVIFWYLEIDVYFLDLICATYFVHIWISVYQSFKQGPDLGS